MIKFGMSLRLVIYALIAAVIVTFIQMWFTVGYGLGGDEITYESIGLMAYLLAPWSIPLEYFDNLARISIYADAYGFATLLSLIWAISINFVIIMPLMIILRIITKALQK